MAQQEHLNVKVTADTKQFVNGMGQVQTNMKQVTKAGGRQAQVWNNLAYALDDAQYGFRGVQNNLQAVAVSAGLTGGAIIGVTAALIAINIAWEKYAKAQREAKKEQEEYTKSLKAAQGGIAKTRLYAEVLRTAKVGTDEYKVALEELKKKGFDPASESLDKFLKLQEAQIILNAVEQANSGKVAGLLANRIKLQEKLKQLQAKGPEKFSALGVGTGGTATSQTALDAAHKAAQARITSEIQAIDTEVKTVINSGAQAVKDILGEDGLAGFILRGKGGGKKALTPAEIAENFELADELADALENLEFAEGEAAPLEAYGDALGKAFVASMKHAVERDLAGALGEGIDNSDAEVKTKITKTASALNAAAASAFSGLGAAIGEALAGDGNFGEKFLKVLGTFMTQFGSALVALGIAEAAWLSSFDPGTKIAAGAALVIAGAAISASYAKKPGGTSSSGFNIGSASGAGVSPTLTQSSQTNQFTLGEVRLRGQDLIATLQSGNRIRRNKT